MSITKLLLICMCFVLTAPSVWGQAANSSDNTGVLGYWDPHTGAFRPVTAATEESFPDAAALITFGGTITVTLTITLKTTSLTAITCSDAVSVVDGSTTGAPRVFSESNTVAATGTGTTRTCKLSIPYSWGLTTPASDNMSTSYSVFGADSRNRLPQSTSTYLHSTPGKSQQTAPLLTYCCSHSLNFRRVFDVALVLFTAPTRNSVVSVISMFEQIRLDAWWAGQLGTWTRAK